MSSTNLCRKKIIKTGSVTFASLYTVESHFTVLGSEVGAKVRVECSQKYPWKIYITWKQPNLEIKPLKSFNSGNI